MEDTLIPNPDGTYVMPDVVWIPLANLEPSSGYRTQLRGMEELENSIRQFGVLSPLWVRIHPKAENRYIIFAGRRRYEAARKIARERCDPSLDAPVSAQLGRYLVPCRVFRDLAEIHQALLALTENSTRRDPSIMDTAREVRRLKSLMESQMGRPVKVNEVLATLWGTRSDQKGPGKRHLYRLLRIGELDPEVMAAAKERRLASEFVDQLTRLPTKEEQLELVKLIANVHLSRGEVRLIVNRRLSGDDAKLADIAVEIAPPSQLTPDGADVAGAILSKYRESVTTEQDAAVVECGSREAGLKAEERTSTTSGQSMPNGLRDGEMALRSLGLGGLIKHLRGQADLDLLRAGDVLEAWAVSEGRRLLPGGDMLKHWLVELSERGHEPGEIGRLRAAIVTEDYSEIEAELMKLLFMCQGVLPEHLPGYVRQIRETMAESAWYRRLVRCFLELAEVLSRPDESKKVSGAPRRLVDIVFHEIFWLATVYDPKLQYHVEKLPPLRKKEFARPALIGRQRID